MVYDNLPCQCTEHQRVQALEKELDEAVSIIRWTLGEGDSDFPGLPHDWPARKFYWRTELREKAATLLAKRGGESSPSAQGESKIR